MPSSGQTSKAASQKEKLDPIGGEHPIGIEQEIPEPQESSQKEAWAPQLKETLRPLISEGEYEAACVRQKRVWLQMYRREVLVLSFEIFEGQHAGIRIDRFYPVRKHIGQGSNYYREWVLANGNLRPRRRDRLTSKKFLRKLFRIQVRTVSTGWDGRSLSAGTRYSRVDRILELMVSDEFVQ